MKSKLEKLAEFIESAVTKIMKASIKIVAGSRHSPGHDCSRKGQNIGKPYLKKVFRRYRVWGGLGRVQVKLCLAVRCS